MTMNTAEKDLEQENAAEAPSDPTAEVAAPESEQEPGDEAGTEAVDEVVKSEETTEAPEEPEEEAPADTNGRLAGEAARYRRQLRTSEAQVADLQAHVAELQEAYVQSLVGDRLAEPELFSLLVQREQWVGADGRIDRDQLETALVDLLTEHPSLAAGSRRPMGRPQPRRGEPVTSRAPGSASDAIDKAFPRADRGSWQNLLEKRPEVDTAGDTTREQMKTRRFKGTIGDEEIGE